MGEGTTVFVAPPLGTVSADTHVAPLRLELELRSIDVAALEQELAAGGFVPQDTIARIEDDLRGVARRLVIQVTAASIIVALVVAAVLPHRRPSSFALAAAGGLVAASLALGTTIATYDQEAFDEPSFTGALARAPAVLEALDRGEAGFDELGSRYEALAGRISELLSLATQPATTTTEDDVTLLHVSDIHSNPLGLEVVKRLERTFDVDAIVDTGDLTSFGQPVEARLGDLLDKVESPYLFVPGNHDSPANRREIDETSKAVLLDQETVEVDGVEILGWADPTFTADNEISTEEGNEARVAEAGVVADAVEELGPDVLAVHDARLAEDSLGLVPLVLTGHTHERSSEEIDGTLVLTVGSTGATGLGSFLVESDLPYEAQVIHLSDGVPRVVDYIKFFGLGEEFEVDREVIETEAEASR